ncbi:alpha/beta fold hydrolase [Methanobrevibacter sp.]|uniref:alpha/beta fold hydrolase n=1 Tax=Methanobrevibacter sp. TaxID=66852 RepID=UPI00386EDA70
MNGVNLNYMLEGSGETVVFVHGLSDNILYWEFLASNLRHDYQVLRVDLRGHGQTDLGEDEISIGTYVDDLYNLLCELGIDRFALVGFSMGGAIALDFAVRYPQMVSSLVLMSCFYKADSHLKNVFNQLRDALEISFEDYYDLILPMVVCPAFIEENRSEIVLLKEAASQSANTQAYIQAIDACLGFDIEEKLSDIDISTLILAGKYDDMTRLDSQEELQGKIKNSRLIVFDDVRHNLLIGKNNEIILDILKKEFK